MDLKKKHHITKVYCSKCDLIFESRERFEKHIDSHSSGIECEACPIDTAISKFVNFFRRKPHRNME